MNGNSCYLIKVELRHLHRRFDYFATRRLYKILTQSSYDVESRVIEYLNNYCYHCKMHEKSFDKLNVIIKIENIQFNFYILVNILYIKVNIQSENKSVLHIMNEDSFSNEQMIERHFCETSLRLSASFLN